MKKLSIAVFLVCLFLFSFFLRFKGISNNYPFWVDEFSTGQFARVLLDRGYGVLIDPNTLFEKHNITTYSLAALSLKIFGQNESSARLPFVLIGSLVPVAVFLLSRKLFNTPTAISAGLLTTTSYFLITWSRQARGYVLLELLIMSALYLYFQIYDSKKSSLRLLVSLGIVSLLGIATHIMFYILLMSMAVHFALSQKLTKKRVLFIIFLGLLILIFAWSQGIIKSLSSSFLGANNLWYYHAFLWREYGLISFLGIIGWLIALSEKGKKFSLILLYISFQLLFVTFIFGHYMTKYVLPIFPLLLIGTSYSFYKISKLITLNNVKRYPALKLFFIGLPVILTLIVVANGNKFVTKPKVYYSINRDFREIANIDYHKIYSVIKNKGRLEENKTLIIETWPPRTRWYLGNNYKNLYLLRWENEQGRVSGHEKKTEVAINKFGERIAPRWENVGFIGNSADLKNAMTRYPRGFIFIDDSTLPKDVIDYAENNLKKELYLDHYPLDDNPYSIWPATLYSWGIE